MSFRKLTSLTAFFSFFVVLVTSFILYLTPQGRIAYWADWHLLGLTKDQWGAIHINLGILFLLSMFLHIYYNWRPIVHYLKDQKVKRGSKESILTLMLVAFCVAGTLLEIPPMSSIMNLNEAIKDKAAHKYGEPPYGHAELSSLASFAQKRNQSIEEIRTALKNSGFRVLDQGQSLKDIAAVNKVSPQKIYLAFPPLALPEKVNGKAILPPEPPPGTGNLSLAELADQYGFAADTIAAKLTAAGITAAQEKTIKEIGSANSMSPIDVYSRVRQEVEAADK